MYKLLSIIKIEFFFAIDKKSLIASSTNVKLGLSSEVNGVCTDIIPTSILEIFSTPNTKSYMPSS